MKEIRRLTIDGMTCQNCVRHVRRALDAVRGVDVRDVTVGSALVQFDPAEVSEEQIVNAVREAGYAAAAKAA